MIGAIRKRDILAHPIVTIQCFGWLVFFRGLVAGRNQTFLSLLAETQIFEPTTTSVPELIGRCIEMEKKAKGIYEKLGEWHIGRPPVKEFFDDLARQEQSHAELLELCRKSASRDSWQEERFSGVRDSLPRQEKEMGAIESSLESRLDVADALRLVLVLESSEINKAFRSVVAGTESGFVRKVRAFQATGARHVTFICDEIPKIEPDLAEECQAAKDRFFDDTAG
jgi:hypothetical protein